MAEAKDKIWIVVAVYNGARFLSEQLDSLKNQSVPPTGVIVSDDFSSDGSLKIIEDFFDDWPECELKLVSGPARGFAANFLHAVALVPDDADFVAFCDQDDVWFFDKMARATQALGSTRNSTGPSLYGAATVLCSAELDILGPSRKFKLLPSFHHALTQNFAGGNTMVLNQAALDIVKSCKPLTEEITAHDWWIYQLIAAAGGNVIYDPQPCLFYRQHDKNVIGSNVGVYATLIRFREMLRGTYKDWNTSNLNALAAVDELLSPVAAKATRQLLDMRQQKSIDRLRTVRELRLHRQGKLGQMGLWLSVLLNRF